ncbi:MAG: protease modulator HflC [Ruminococcaceae bacterium]|nr:protease modulator HflC [Oscillospiraceae bacterium]
MKKVVKITLIVVLALLCIGLASSMYVVEENEYAFVLRFNKVENIRKEAGLHFKIPFLDSVKTLPSNTLQYDLAPSDVLTSDSKAMSVDSYVLWKITDPMTFYKTVGSISEAQSRLDAATYNALKNIIGTITQDSIITASVEDGRTDLNVTIYEQVKELTDDYGITVSDVKIKRLDLPAENEAAVYERMISDRKQIAEKHRAEGEAEATKLRSEVDKKVNILISDAEAQAAVIEAEGESEYMKMLADAFNTKEKQEFYEFVRSLEALETSLDGNNNTIILDEDSDIVKTLMGLEN